MVVPTSLRKVLWTFLVFFPFLTGSLVDANRFVILGACALAVEVVFFDETKFGKHFHARRADSRLEIIRAGESMYVLGFIAGCRNRGKEKREEVDLSS
jgi:hypothetical protein